MFQVLPRLPVSDFPRFAGIRHADGYHYRRPCQWGSRWMTFMGLQFQPSELAKMAVIIAVSFILSKRQDEEGANPKAFKYIMILTGLVLLLIAPETCRQPCCCSVSYS